MYPAYPSYDLVKARKVLTSPTLHPLSTPPFDIHLADIFDIFQNLICTFIVFKTAPSLIISTVYKVIGTYHIEPWDEQIALERLVYKNSGLNTGTYVNKQSGKWRSFIWS